MGYPKMEVIDNTVVTEASERIKLTARAHQSTILEINNIKIELTDEEELTLSAVFTSSSMAKKMFKKE